jgi:hypothetical protein
MESGKAAHAIYQKPHEPDGNVDHELKEESIASLVLFNRQVVAAPKERRGKEENEAGPRWEIVRGGRRLSCRREKLFEKRSLVHRRFFLLFEATNY